MSWCLIIFPHHNWQKISGFEDWMNVFPINFTHNYCTINTAGWCWYKRWNISVCLYFKQPASRPNLSFSLLSWLSFSYGVRNAAQSDCYSYQVCSSACFFFGPKYVLVGPIFMTFCAGEILLKIFLEDSGFVTVGQTQDPVYVKIHVRCICCCFGYY